MWLSLLQQTLACSILTALLSEFSSSSKTSSIGLSMEFHGSCKRLFQVRSLHLPHLICAFTYSDEDLLFCVRFHCFGQQLTVYKDAQHVTSTALMSNRTWATIKKLAVHPFCHSKVLMHSFLRFLILFVFLMVSKMGRKSWSAASLCLLMTNNLILHHQSWCQLIPPTAFFSIFIIFNSKMQPLFYFPCVYQHQEDGLRQIFMLTMEVLQEFSRRENLNAQMSSVFQRYLALANQVLSWNFLPPNYILSVTPGNVRMTGLTISWSRNMAPERQVCPSYL